MKKGRKTLYEDSFPLLGESFARQGLDDKQIAAKLCISLAAYYRYQNAYIEFRDAIKRGKRPVDVEVENALLKRALGFDFTEKATEVEVGLDGEPKPAKIKETKKHIPGDVTAQIFWLKNRNPEAWRDHKTVEATGKDGTPLIPSRKIDISKLTPEQQEAIVSIGMQLEEGNE